MVATTRLQVTIFSVIIPENRKVMREDTVNELPMTLFDENNVGRSVELSDLF